MEKEKTENINENVTDKQEVTFADKLKYVRENIIDFQNDIKQWIYSGVPELIVKHLSSTGLPFTDTDVNVFVNVDGTVSVINNIDDKVLKECLDEINKDAPDTWRKDAVEKTNYVNIDVLGAIIHEVLEKYSSSALSDKDILKNCFVSVEMALTKLNLAFCKPVDIVNMMSQTESGWVLDIGKFINS